MKEQSKCHGWLLILTFVWLWAEPNSLIAAEKAMTDAPAEAVPPTEVVEDAKDKALLESAASRKMYGVDTGDREVIEPEPVSLTEVMIRIVGALMIVMAILLGGAWWFRKSRLFGLVPAQSSHLNVIETRSLGSRHALHVVEYGSKRFLIADSPAGTNFLTDLEKLEEEATEELDEAAEKISPGSFAGKLKTLLERK
jgi:flagellar biogenesis protein FliO